MADWETVRYDPSYDEPLDPEILPLCDVLNGAGFVTTSSCCGHGQSWPYVYFQHGDERRIEKMARFIMATERGAARPHFSQFSKEVLDQGYRWCLEIHLNNVFAGTPPNLALRQATHAIQSVTRALLDWQSQNEK